MWMKIMGKDGIQFMTVATSDQITGPYRIVNEKIHPGGMNSGDFDPSNIPNMGNFDPSNIPNMGNFDPSNMPTMNGIQPRAN